MQINDMVKKLETSTNIEELKHIRFDIINYIDTRIKKVHLDNEKNLEIIRRNNIIKKGVEVSIMISDLLESKEANIKSLDKAFISAYCDFCSGLIYNGIESYNLGTKYRNCFRRDNEQGGIDIFDMISKLYNYENYKTRCKILMVGISNIDTDILHKDINRRINNLSSEDKELLGFFLSLDLKNKSYHNIFKEIFSYNGYIVKFADGMEPGNIILKTDNTSMISCRLGDVLVEAGIGYWIHPIDNGLLFAIPRTLYDIAKKCMHYLPEIEDKETFFKTKVLGWDIFKKINELDHDSIRDLIANNLNKVEDGLKLIDTEYRCSDIGKIDVLCKGKDNKHVIIEIKRKYNSDKTVGQAQRYISYIENNPIGKLKGVRYIIILPSKDEKLEHSFLSSAYRDCISIIILDEYQIKKLSRFCENCHCANKLTAMYCSRCGERFENNKYRYVDTIGRVTQENILYAWSHME